MLFLVLGKGKTGSLVAEVARERGHGVRALDIKENLHASALTAPIWPASTPSSTSPPPRPPLKTCAPSSPSAAASSSAPPAGTRTCRDEGPRRKARRRPPLRHQLLHRRAETLPPHRRPCQARRLQFSIAETHHTSKLDAPSGTAITLKKSSSPCSPARGSDHLAPRGRRQRRTHRHRHQPRTMFWSSATTPTAAAALPSAPSAAPSGSQANPAPGTSAKSSTSYESGITELTSGILIAAANFI